MENLNGNMSNNWKEELEKLSYEVGKEKQWIDVEKFIETQVIEKLIEDACKYGAVDRYEREQQLRSRWLGKESL